MRFELVLQFRLCLTPPNSTTLHLVPRAPALLRTFSLADHLLCSLLASSPRAISPPPAPLALLATAASKRTAESDVSCALPQINIPASLSDPRTPPDPLTPPFAPRETPRSPALER